MLTGPVTVVIISQYTQILTHHVIHLELIGCFMSIIAQKTPTELLGANVQGTEPDTGEERAKITEEELFRARRLE